MRARQTSRRARNHTGFVLFAFCALASSAAALAAQEPAQNRREFTIVAKDHTFTPDRLEVSQDDLVKIILKSEDRPASFAIDAYRIIKRVAGNSSISFDFRADQAGTFRFYCNLTKDPDCKDMAGTLVVKPK
jgi:heme/copper-type cytochrome/quinol oxidase subunit 2